MARNGRRRWSSEPKRAIVAAGFAPGAVVRDVARQNDVTSSLIYRWRRELRAAANDFARVLMAPAGDGIGPPPPAPVIGIEFAGNTRADPGFSVAGFGGRRRWGIGAAVIPVPSGMRVWLSVGTPTCDAA